MSMFHELMMRKKEETMYAMIKGTLTESPYGVFSGFSSSNYLRLDNVLQESEFVVKFTTSSNITSRQLVMSSARLIEISVWDDYIKTYNFQSNQTVSLFSIQANTTYWVKTKITSTTKTFSISTDGKNYGNDITINDTSGTGTNIIRFGTHINNLGYNFLGSIDLNNSYIKLGATKYNLQAVVGYTVVGSPTITDGVVSGFSSANYLKINVPTAINYNVFELDIKFKTSDSSVYQRLFWNLNNLLFVMTGGSLSLNFYNTSNNWTSRSAGAIQNNTWYWYKIKFDIVNKTMIADRSTDGINFTNVLSSQNISNINSAIKITTNGIIFCDQDNSGNITLDLNSTNIKKDNKLWFNGQQA